MKTLPCIVMYQTTHAVIGIYQGSKQVVAVVKTEDTVKTARSTGKSHFKPGEALTRALRKFNPTTPMLTTQQSISNFLKPIQTIYPQELRIK